MKKTYGMLSALTALVASTTGAAPALAGTAPAAQAGEAVHEVVMFKGSAETTPMWFTGLSPTPGLVQPDGQYHYRAPADQQSDFCLAKQGALGPTSSCTVDVSGGLTSTKNPLTGAPLQGPFCDRTTGVHGAGTVSTGAGRVYELADIAWITSAGGSLITGRWHRRDDGERGHFRAPVATRRGFECANPEGSAHFSVSGVIVFLQHSAA